MFFPVDLVCSNFVRRIAGKFLSHWFGWWDIFQAKVREDQIEFLIDLFVSTPVGRPQAVDGRSSTTTEQSNAGNNA